MACRGGQLRRLCGVVGATFLGACSMMPANGPASYDVKSERAYEPDSLPYAVVRITPQAEGIIAEYNPRISGTFPDRRIPKELRFGIGHLVAVSIFESSSGGLFIPRLRRAFALETLLHCQISPLTPRAISACLMRAGRSWPKTKRQLRCKLKLSMR